MRGRARKPRKTNKILHQHSVLGQQGVNLIEKIVLRMGYAWHPSGNLETGIDAIIEIRDPATGQTTNSIVQVQSKATEKGFQSETANTLEYSCRDRDIAYWLRGNAPVILVHSRPSTGEAYWVSIKDYFADPVKHNSRKIVFDKKQNLFEPTDVCAAAIRDLAIPRESGIYFTPVPKKERLYSNLISVAFPDRLYVAQTEYRYPSQIWTEMNKIGIQVGSDFLLGYKAIMSFHDLGEHPWDKVCESGAESFETWEWSKSDDPDRLRDFVQLLNQCLKEKTWKAGLRYSKRCDCYYFKATPDLSPRRISYPSFKETTSRQVFRGYYRRGDATQISYYRHSAFGAQFLKHDGEWYLEITPTYYYTWNGIHLDEFYEDKLKKIKTIERNLAVVGQVLMWVDYLSRPKNLFSDPYPFLIMGKPVSFDLEHGIADEIWLPNEDADTRATLQTSEPTLFD